MTNSTTVHDIKALVLSYHSLLVMETVEEERVTSVLQAVARDLRVPLFDWSLTRGLVRSSSGPFAGTENPAMMLKQIEEFTSEAIFLLKDFSSHLQNDTVRRTFRELVGKFQGSRSTFVLTGDPVELPRDLEKLAVKIDFFLPEQAELKEMINSLVRSLRQTTSVELKLGSEEASSLLRALSGLTLSQARQTVAHAIIEDGKLTPDDIGRIVKRKGEMIEQGGLLEYFPSEDNHFALGGFARLKSWLERARIGFTPAARELNLPPPHGVLFVGVQGCGKSLAAKFIARTWELPLLKLDGGRLYDKYIGESERNLRRAIALAESMAPVVLWIDEIEKVFVPAGSAESDAGLSRRMFGSFLTWMQEKKKEVFVVGAANDLSIVPPELLRKGRFDEIFFVDLPTVSERAEMQAEARGLRHPPTGCRHGRFQRRRDRAGGDLRALSLFAEQGVFDDGRTARRSQADRSTLGLSRRRHRRSSRDGARPLCPGAISPFPWSGFRRQRSTCSRSRAG